ncbi:hypothetical protein [Nitrincola nitratireducens]|uniref:Uncharacterized protein n=1 Tax=Nitrincola nitratireducens TaxID=1229521 RepID=W9UYE5_9GAMM|nr:hypothetical protein [Nitrincola nitratireducens]EXJ12109.1 hypothetical protein D791_00998 [Nitrincola nitratireducens]
MIQIKCLFHSLTLMCIITLTGCSTPAGDRPFYIKNLAKSDIDLVADAHIDEINRLSRELTIKLYQRNPRELAKAPAEHPLMTGSPYSLTLLGLSTIQSFSIDTASIAFR